MANKHVNRIFTSEEVAEICGVSSDTVSRWFDLGQIEGYRLGDGGDRRIPYENLRKYMLGHGIPIERLDEGQKCILVVDDDPFYLDTIPSILSKLDTYKIIVASTGFEAGAEVVENNPQLIILDIHVSDMDGRMVWRRVKDRDETKSTRILAISGYIDDEEAQELREFGFDDTLKKPFSLNDLTECVKKLIDLPANKVARPKARSTTHRV